VVESRVRVAMICTGNICRSPIAEGVFRMLVERERLSGRITIDSAGTHDYQLGEQPDPRAMRAAKSEGSAIASSSRSSRNSSSAMTFIAPAADS